MEQESSGVAHDDLSILAAHQELTARDHLIGLEAQVARLERDLARVRERNGALRAKVGLLEDELSALRGSRTWKLGRALTRPWARARG